jgi:hypothetical protein
MAPGSKNRLQILKTNYLIALEQIPNTIAFRLAGRPVGQPAGYSFLHWWGFIRFAQQKELGQPKANTCHETHVFIIRIHHF